MCKYILLGVYLWCLDSFGQGVVYWLRESDEISTGLDSSTTYDIVKWLGDSTHALGFTALVALLQPAPETFELFTDVLPASPPAHCCDPHILSDSGCPWN